MKPSSSPLIVLLLLIGSYISSAASPTLRRSQSVRPFSLQFGNQATTIRTSLFFLNPQKSSSSSSSKGKSDGDKSKPTTSTSSSPDEEPIPPTSHVTDPIITHPLTTLPPLTTFIQDDDNKDIQPTSLPPTSGNATSTCRNFPTPSAFRICNTKLLVFLYLVLYIAVLRTILYLEELSATQVLDLGERLARCRDSYGGWAWEVQGSWKVRQQPDLPAIAVLGMEGMMGVSGVLPAGERQQQGIADEGEPIRLEDMDYRRKDTERRGDTTPEETPQGVDEEEQEGRPEGVTSREQQQAWDERRRQVVLMAHKRILDDTRSKRVVYGVVITFASLGVAFAILAVLHGLVCGQIWRLGRCPYAEKEL
ncbi:hypothetical protein ABW20_dc0102614 [Dactylellina cionopaga]|nr:hypothetical protein ABW20_dc0102614 [Dactylellina cionopaga]